MIEISGMMWLLAICFGVIGFLRGWQREFTALAGIILATFALFQFDAFLRTIFFGFSAQQMFFVQFVSFTVIVFLVYQAKQVGGGELRSDDDLQDGLIGGLVGSINGYLIGGSIWYFLDVTEYPFVDLVSAPAPNSLSAESLGLMPMMLLGGGADGTGGALSIGVLILVVAVLLSI
ncbi:MAG: CvpA family protein [Anaerolineae bacterium]